jgi:hypothetical protein
MDDPEEIRALVDGVGFAQLVSVQGRVSAGCPDLKAKLSQHRSEADRAGVIQG